MCTLSPCGPEPHPLRAIVEAQKIPLWSLRFKLGGSPSEGHLSRMLRGITPMSPDMVKRIEEALNGKN